jgi:hypothetical protein
LRFYWRQILEIPRATTLLRFGITLSMCAASAQCFLSGNVCQGMRHNETNGRYDVGRRKAHGTRSQYVCGAEGCYCCHSNGEKCAHSSVPNALALSCCTIKNKPKDLRTIKLLVSVINGWRRTVGTQSSRPAEFGGRGISFNIFRGTLGRMVA